MRRQWHILKANRNCETAQNCVYFDTETKAKVNPDGSEQDYLTFGWLCARRRTSQGKWGPPKWVRFDSVHGFWRALDKVVRAKSRWFLFCHNTSFDLPVLNVFGMASKYGWVLKAAVIEAPPTIVTFRRDTCTLVFLDTLNWWRMPLAKLGERLDLPKLTMPEEGAPKREWDIYCKRDVEVICTTVERWLDFLVAHDLGGFASTLASQAFRTYRHRFMQHEIVIDADDATCAIARESYCGGRVECFQLGTFAEDTYGVDINQMYPSVMAGNNYPVKLLGHYPTQARTRWKRLVKDYALVARCVVEASAPCYPLKTKHGLAFPLGLFSTVLTTPEISLALKRGDLREMSDIAVYEKARIFDGYVKFMSGERILAQREAREVDAWFFKHMGTNLYGKFGQTGQVYETEEFIEDLSCKKYTILDHDTREVKRVRQLAGLLQIMSAEGEARDSFPAIASHVTAYGRCLLWRLIEAAGLSEVRYGDTDSLFLTRLGADRVKGWMHPTRLGKLKPVGIWPWIKIHGLKDYEVPGHVVRKGVRAAAVEIAPNTFRQVQWTSLKGLLGKGDMTAPGRKMIVKKLARVYKKPRAV